MHNHNQMQLFRNVIDECDFLDLGFVRKKIAWSRHFVNGHSIWESLDFQVLEFNIFTVIHQITILFLLILQVLRFLKETNLFCFEEMWLLDNQCREQSGNGMEKFLQPKLR